MAQGNKKKIATQKAIEQIAGLYLVENPIRDFIAEEDARRLSVELTAAFDNIYCGILPDGQGKKVFSVCSSSTRRVFLRGEIIDNK